MYIYIYIYVLSQLLLRGAAVGPRDRVVAGLDRGGSPGGTSGLSSLLSIFCLHSEAKPRPPYYYDYYYLYYNHKLLLLSFCYHLFAGHKPRMSGKIRSEEE